MSNPGNFKYETLAGMHRLTAMKSLRKTLSFSKEFRSNFDTVICKVYKGLTQQEKDEVSFFSFVNLLQFCLFLTFLFYFFKVGFIDNQVAQKHLAVSFWDKLSYSHNLWEKEGFPDVESPKINAVKNLICQLFFPVNGHVCFSSLVSEKVF